jgi:hypothetical protein
MKRRWLIYILIGIAFGVFDFYYHGFISNLPALQQFNSAWNGIAWIILSIGIWLVPIIPIILHEAKISHSPWLSALASTLIWCVSVAAYYLTNGFQLAFIGVPSRPEMHISNRNDAHFLTNWKELFFGDLVGGSLEWLVVAVVGGISIGFLLSFVYLRLKSSREVKTVPPGVFF